MATLEQVQTALQMWKDGATHGIIKEVTGLTHEEEYAITEVSSRHRMTAKRILPRLDKLQAGMKANEIEAIILISSPVEN